MIPKAALDWYKAGKSKGVRPEELRANLSDQGYVDSEIDLVEKFASLKHNIPSWILWILKGIGTIAKIAIWILIVFMILFLLFILVEIGFGNGFGYFIGDLTLIVAGVFLASRVDRIQFIALKFFDRLLP